VPGKLEIEMISKMGGTLEATARDARFFFAEGLAWRVCRVLGFGLTPTCVRLSFGGRLLLRC